MRVLFASAVFLLLSACQTLPTPNQTDAADYGDYPDNYQQIARDFLMAELRDPQSIEIQSIGSPEKRWIGDKIRGTKYGYLVCVEVNSKNLLSKMTGFRSDALLIRDAQVIEHVKDGELISGMQLCN